jgi:hypothetical protein
MSLACAAEAHVEAEYRYVQARIDINWSQSWCPLLQHITGVKGKGFSQNMMAK